MKRACLFILSLTILFISCDNDTSRKEIGEIQEKVLLDLIQKFQVEGEEGMVEIETQTDCIIRLNTENLSIDGKPTSGKIDIEVIEIFDKGTMALSGKHTMTDDRLLSSGGEFFVKALSEGDELDLSNTFRVRVPAKLTGGVKDSMELFYGGAMQISDENWSLVQINSDVVGVSTMGDVEEPRYLIGVDQFKWFNCDRFYDFPGPKKNIDVKVPSYLRMSDYKVYLTIEGEDSTLGKITSTSLYPLGLRVHIIFFTPNESSDNELLYDIRSTQLDEDTKIIFNANDLKSIAIEGLIDKINSLP